MVVRCCSLSLLDSRSVCWDTRLQSWRPKRVLFISLPNHPRADDRHRLHHQELLLAAMTEIHVQKKWSWKGWSRKFSSTLRIIERRHIRTAFSNQREVHPSRCYLHH